MSAASWACLTTCEPPCPGPGLGIRHHWRGHARAPGLARSHPIAREELTAAGLDQEIWQCPVVLLADALRSVASRVMAVPTVTLTLRPSSEDARYD